MDSTNREHDTTDKLRAPPNVPSPRLVLALERERPLAPRWSAMLANIESVLIGRSKQTEFALVDAGRQLLVTVDDGWLSKRHARIAKGAGGWTIVDEGSRNGTFINGQQVEQRRLVDGDHIEVGRTHLYFSDSKHAGAIGVPPVRSIDPTRLGAASVVGHTFAPALECVHQEIERIARTASPVLVTGETGTGKERIARAIHDLSGRKGEFVAFNCGAVREELIESELFGSRRGAFTGAVERAGWVRAAHNGTLLLDEIGDLPQAAQAALLRVLEEHVVVPLGGTRGEKVDFRLISATNWNLVELIESRRFRPDLYARIRGFPASLPPLRNRREDIGWLIGLFLVEQCGAGATLTFTRDAARALLAWRWPHNIRELKQCVAAAVGLAGGCTGVIELVHLPEEVRGDAASAPALSTLPALNDRVAPNCEQLIAALLAEKGNISRVARSLKTTRAQIHRWMKRYGIDPRKYRSR